MLVGMNSIDGPAFSSPFGRADTAGKHVPSLLFPLHSSYIGLLPGPLYGKQNEEIYWRLQGRLTWTLRGDSNAAYFRTIADGCRHLLLFFGMAPDCFRTRMKPAHTLMDLTNISSVDSCEVRSAFMLDTWATTNAGLRGGK